MSNFHYQASELYCENISLTQIAQEVGTPAYVYSLAEIKTRAHSYQQTGQSDRKTVCYAVKANQNPRILEILRDAGLGADVTSGGELFLALHAGIAPEKIIYSGVGKRRDEIIMALDANIRALHVESAMELDVIAEIASERQQIARIGVRVNPNISVETHPYMSTGETLHKFGVTPETAVSLLHTAREHPWLQPVGVAAHIGSQILDIEPFVASAQFLANMAEELASSGINLNYIDVGGGLGIDYQSPAASPQISEWVTAVSTPVHQADFDIVMEPGRSIIAPTGMLLTTVEYLKMQGKKPFLIVDAGMNDLLRPTLYKAYHPIMRVQQKDSASIDYDIVGPICETGDTFAQERPLPTTIAGDLLAIGQAGAYGYAMSSNYNGRLRPAEVLVDGNQYSIIRQRQTYEHLLDGIS